MTVAGTIDGADGLGPRDPGFHHDAVFYAGMDEFLRGIVPFLELGLERDEPALVAVDRDKLEALRDVLDDPDGRVELAPMAEVGRNPGRIISIWRDFVLQHRGRPVRGVGEPIWADRSAEALLECQQHEHLLNHAFVGPYAFTLRCPYDTSVLPAEVLAEAARSHPYVTVDGSTSVSPTYELAEPSEILDAALAPRPAGARTVALATVRLSELRQELRVAAVRAGLPAWRAEDVVLVVSELIANSLQYGGTSGSLSTWTGGGQHVAEVCDEGRIRDPLTGRRRPASSARAGRGLWLAHELSDLLQVRSNPERTIVRAAFDLPPG